MTAARSSTKADAEHARQQQLEHQTVVDACRELATLWPHLIDALPRDSASSGADTNGGSNTSAALVNHDVAEATTQIRRWLATADAECRRLLKIDPIYGRGGVLGILGCLPAWHHRLQQLNLPTAGYLAADAAHALRTARRAIGLTQPGYRLGTCPNHPDTKTPLIRLGHEGTLDVTIIDAAEAGINAPYLVTTGAITWNRGVTIRCPHCHQTWTGPIGLLALEQQLRETK